MFWFFFIYKNVNQNILGIYLIFIFYKKKVQLQPKEYIIYISRYLFNQILNTLLTPYTIGNNKKKNRTRIGYFINKMLAFQLPWGHKNLIYLISQIYNPSPTIFDKFGYLHINKKYNTRVSTYTRLTDGLSEQISFCRICETTVKGALAGLNHCNVCSTYVNSINDMVSRLCEYTYILCGGIMCFVYIHNVFEMPLGVMELMCGFMCEVAAVAA